MPMAYDEEIPPTFVESVQEVFDLPGWVYSNPELATHAYRIWTRLAKSTWQIQSARWSHDVAALGNQGGVDLSLFQERLLRKNDIYSALRKHECIPKAWSVKWEAQSEPFCRASYQINIPKETGREFKDICNTGTWFKKHLLHILCFVLAFLSIFSSYKIKKCVVSSLQSKTNKRTHYGFEHQFQQLYTKTVFKEYQAMLKKSTLFRIKPNPDYPDLDEYNYLVTYHQPTTDFSWSNHQFRVLADPIGGDYRCECLLWEHTGTTL